MNQDQSRSNRTVAGIFKVASDADFKEIGGWASVSTQAHHRASVPQRSHHDEQSSPWVSRLDTEPLTSMSLEQIVNSQGQQHHRAENTAYIPSAHPGQTVHPHSMLIHPNEDPYLQYDGLQGLLGPRQISKASPTAMSRLRSDPGPQSPLRNSGLSAVNQAYTMTPSAAQQRTAPRQPYQLQGSVMPYPGPPNGWAGPYYHGHGAEAQLQQRADYSNALAVLEPAQVAPDSRRRTFSCLKCDKTFFDQPGLRKHETIHNRALCNNKQCPACGRKFRYPKDLVRHEIDVHEMPTPDEHIFKCEYCGKSFKSREDNLRRHITTVHNPNRPRHGRRRTGSSASFEVGMTPSARRASEVNQAGRQFLGVPGPAARRHPLSSSASSPRSEAVFSQPSSPLLGGTPGSSSAASFYDNLDPRLWSQ